MTENINSISVQAPAKVNILLRVVGRREDGYHDLQMVMVPLTLCDEIVMTKRKEGFEFSLDGQSDPGMQGDKNLAVRAARLIANESEYSGGVSIALKKNTPVAAGLGGGSSDAAAVLKGLNKLWDLGLSPARLAAIGSRLGADVPFFCYDAPAFVARIGDKVFPYSSFPNVSFLLINPGFAVSTPWVYREFDLKLTQKTSNARVRPLFQVFSDVLGSLHNDLESVTIKAFPEIEEIKGMLIKNGALGSLMSGSGPTVFGVFESSAVRDTAHEKIAGLRSNWRIFAADVKMPYCAV